MKRSIGCVLFLGILLAAGAALAQTLEPLDTLAAIGNRQGASRDTVAFLCIGASGVCAIDARDPGALAILSTVNTSGNAQSLVERNGYLYVADQTQVQVIDARNPRGLTLVGAGDPAGTGSREISIAGRLLTVLDSYYLLRIFSVDDPANAVAVYNYQADGT